MIVEDIVELSTCLRLHRRRPLGGGSRYLRSIGRQALVDRCCQRKIVEVRSIAAIRLLVGGTRHVEVTHQHHRGLPCGIVTSAIEHPAVLRTCEWLEKQGFEITYVPVDADGLVNPADVEAAITDKTILISIMAANNEIGTIEPIEEIAKIAHAHHVLFHTDAVQAIGAIPVDVRAIGCDLLSLSGHKFHGPKGVGALYIKQGTRIDNLIHGGAQERGRRASTENVAGIVGMAEAIELATANIPEKAARISALRDQLIDGLTALPYVRLNGHRTKRLPGNVNVSVRFIEGESLLLRLDLAGVAASSGSACTSGSLDPSHVLLAIGLPHEIAHGSLRLSLSDTTTQEEVDYVLSVLPGIIEYLRDMSPLYNDFMEAQK